MDELRQLNFPLTVTACLASLDKFMDNNAAVGHMIEQAILTAINSKGLPFVTGIRGSMDVRTLTDSSSIKTDMIGKPVLYRPEKHNFEAIDGMIILIKPSETKKNTKKKTQEGKPKLLMFLLQITVDRRSHSDSHAIFFNKYTKWTDKLSKFDVVPEFIWITPGEFDDIHHQASGDVPEHKERYIHISKVDIEIWEKYVAAKATFHRMIAASGGVRRDRGSTRRGSRRRGRGGTRGGSTSGSHPSTSGGPRRSQRNITRIQ